MGISMYACPLTLSGRAERAMSVAQDKISFMMIFFVFLVWNAVVLYWLNNKFVEFFRLFLFFLIPCF